MARKSTAEPEQLTLDFDALQAPPEGVRPSSSAVPGTRAEMQPVGPDQPQGELRLEVVHSPRRRTLGLEVHRDLRVVVRAPLACPDDVVARYVARNRRWIARQLVNFQKLPAPRPPLRYVAGETHWFLGRGYTLVLRPESSSKVMLQGETLVVGGVGASSPVTAQSALSRWYLARARAEFPKSLARCHAHPRFSRYPLPSLRIRTMRTRWGTMCRERGMTLNTALILAPIDCLDYVVFHELCHLSYRGHGARFYQLLEAVLPDWEARKRTLEAAMPF
jgi:predicted metal-dependent hydrolase